MFVYICVLGVQKPGFTQKCLGRGSGVWGIFSDCDYFSFPNAFSIWSMYYLWKNKGVLKRPLWKQEGRVTVAGGAVATVQGT